MTKVRKSFTIQIPKDIPDNTATEVKSELRSGDIVEYAAVFCLTTGERMWVDIRFATEGTGLEFSELIVEGVASQHLIDSSNARLRPVGGRPSTQVPQGGIPLVSAMCFHKRGATLKSRLNVTLSRLVEVEN